MHETEKKRTFIQNYHILLHNIQRDIFIRIVSGFMFLFHRNKTNFYSLITWVDANFDEIDDIFIYLYICIDIYISFWVFSKMYFMVTKHSFAYHYEAVVCSFHSRSIIFCAIYFWGFYIYCFGKHSYVSKLCNISESN